MGCCGSRTYALCPWLSYLNLNDYNIIKIIKMIYVNNFDMNYQLVSFWAETFFGLIRINTTIHWTNDGYDSYLNDSG